MKPSDFPRPAKFHTAGPPLCVDGMWYVRDLESLRYVGLNPVKFSRDHSQFASDPDIHSIAEGYWMTEEARADGSPGRYAVLHGLTARFFAPEAVRPMEQVAKYIASELIGPIVKAGPSFDLTDLAYGVAFRVICVFTGFPKHSETFVRQELKALIDREGFDMSPESPEFRKYLQDIPAQRPAGEPEDDLLGTLVNAQRQGAISTRELRGFFGMFFAAGYDMGTTLTNMIALLDEFGLLDEARAQLDDSNWVSRALEETMRFMPSFTQGFTMTTEDVALPDGTAIPAFSPVVVCYAAASRDPGVFDEPDRFIVARHPNPHAGFGHGRHYCTGAPLARVVIPAAFTTILRLLPGLRLHPDPERFRRHAKVTDYLEATAVYDHSAARR